jgi:hypothetical protein
LIVLLTLCGCCCGGIIYFVYLGYKYFAGNGNMSKAGINEKNIEFINNQFRKGPTV